MKDILDRIADSSPNESSHELICRLRDCAREIEALRAAAGKHAPAVEADLAEEAHVAKRMSETLADVYLTILGDDNPDTEGTAIEKVIKAAKVLRMEVELYRASEAAAGEPVAVTVAEFETAIETLRHVIDCLRKTGSYTDEEGEATDYLEPLLQAQLAAPQPASEQQAEQGLSDEQAEALVLIATKHIGDKSLLEQTKCEVRAILAAKGDGHAD